MSTFNPDDYEEDTTSEPVVDKPTEEPNYDGVSVNNRYTPVLSVISHVSGYSWTGVYFSQILGDDDAPQEHSLELDATLQQYKKIINFELRVQSPLEYSYSEDEGKDMLQGEAIIYPGTIIPQRHDVFVAGIGDGRSGMFTISGLEPLSIMMERAYRITYHLLSSTTQERLDDLNYKSAVTEYFNKSYLRHGKDPLVNSQEVHLYDSLATHRESMVEDYGHSFIDPDVKMLVVPDQEESTYDFYLSRYLMRKIETSQDNYMRDAHWPSIRKLDDLRSLTIWDMMLSEHVSIEMLESGRIEKKMVVTTAWAFKNSPFFNSIYYTKIKRALWPFSERSKVSTTYELLRNSDDTHDYIGLEVGDHLDTSTTEPSTEIADKPDIYAVDVDDYYIFSTAFYNGDKVSQSQLEYMVTLMCEGEVLPLKMVDNLCNQSYHWAKLERFYYVPILILLAEYSIRRARGG